MRDTEMNVSLGSKLKVEGNLGDQTINGC